MSRFFYNSKNQQIRTETEDGQVQENRYDVEGLRYEVRENANRIRFVYRGSIKRIMKKSTAFPWCWPIILYLRKLR